MKNLLLIVALIMIATANILATPMNGTYTIGGTLPDFATINDAVNALYANGMNTNSILANPLFVLTDVPDLQPSSPAINAGLTISNLTEDIYETTRIAPYDIGAYEYVGSIAPDIPQNVIIEIISGNSVQISWDAASQATQYRLESSDNQNSGFSEVDTTTNTTIDIPIAMAKKFYRVIAIH